jgi:hypothetical protein
LTWTSDNVLATLVLPHLGHFCFCLVRLSYSARGQTCSKALLHFSQRNSYVGMMALYLCFVVGDDTDPGTLNFPAICCAIQSAEHVPLACIMHASRKTHDIVWIEFQPWRSGSSLALGIPDFTSQIPDFIFGI